MPAPIVEGQPFDINPEAQRLHQSGLYWESEASYHLALATLQLALGVLAEEPRTVDSEVQTSRIERDIGFVDTRDAIAAHDIDQIYRASHVVDEASRRTRQLLARSGSVASGTEPLLSLTRTQRRELYAEHGATISLLGRIGTVKEVVFDIKDTDPSPSVNFDTAYGLLLHGNNGYYRVSNAMAAARYERINHNPAGMAFWLGKATVGLAWTAMRDPRNLLPATGTALVGARFDRPEKLPFLPGKLASLRVVPGRMTDLRSHQTAVESVALRP